MAAVLDAAVRITFTEAVVTAISGAGSTPNNDYASFKLFAFNMERMDALLARIAMVEQMRQVRAEEREVACLERMVARLESAALTGYRK